MGFWFPGRLRSAGRSALALGGATALLCLFVTALGATPAAADSSPVTTMASGTSRSIALLAAGGTETAFQGADSDLFTTGPDGLNDTHLGMMAGTSPSITALSGGGYEVAFQANTGELWTVGAAGDQDWHLGMMAGTSPAITALPGGSFEVAFQANTSELWTVGAAGDQDWHLGMMAGTSPSITDLPGMSNPDAYEVAFQANTSELWTVGAAGDQDWHLGMMAGTSPSITALSGSHLASGGFEAAFQANNSELWTVGAAGNQDWHLGMMAGTSPSVSGTRDGGFETAFQANTGQLWTVGGASGADSGNWGVPLMAGDSPAIAVQPDDQLEVTMGGPGGQLLDVRHAMAPAATYVAVGDSYSSGEGAGSYDSSSGGCDRSPNSWPAQLASSLQGPSQLTFYLQACSGAKIGDVTAQEQSTVNNGDDLITVTAGGNDANFGSALTACIAVGACGGLTLTNAQASIISQQAFNLYRDIAQRAIHSTIVVVGYPDIFPPASSGCGDQSGNLSPSQLTAIHSSIQLLNLNLREAVSAVDNAAGTSRQGYLAFFDPNADGSWAGHDICSSQSQRWGNGVTDADHTAGIFHPNLAGNTHLCQQVHNYLFGTPSCTPPSTPAQQAGCTPLPQPAEGFAPDPQSTDTTQPEVCDWQPSLDDPSQPSEDEPAPDVSSTISYDTCSTDPSAAGCGQASSTITYDICTQYPTAANCPGQPDQAGDAPPGSPDDPCVIDPTAPGCPFALPDDPAPPDPEQPDTGGVTDNGGGGGGGGAPFQGDPLMFYED